MSEGTLVGTGDRVRIGRDRVRPFVERGLAVAETYGPIACAVALFAVAIYLRFSALGDRVVFRDEAASWLTASLPLPELIRRVSGESYAPLYALLLKVWMAVFGDGLPAIRAFSGFFAIVTLFAAWRWASEAINRYAGLVVLAVAAFVPFAIAEARNARMYSLESAFATVGWWMAWRLVSDEWSSSTVRARRAMGIVLAVCVAGEIWTMAYGIPIAGLQLASAAIFGFWRRRPMAPIAIVAGGLTYLAWIPAFLSSRSTNEKFWTGIPDLRGFQDNLIGWSGGGWYLPFDFSLHIVLGAVLVGMALLALRRRVPLALMVLAALALAPAIWWISQVRPVFDNRYFGSLLAPLLIGFAAAVAMRLRVRNEWVLWIARVALAATVLTQTARAGIDYAAYWRVEPGVAPAPEAMEIVASQMKPGDVVITPDARSYFLAEYLTDRSDRPIRIPGPVVSYHRADEPAYNGIALVGASDLIDADLVARKGLRAALPQLAPDGHVWLVALANNADLSKFTPLRDGSAREVASWTFHNHDTLGQVRELEVIR